MQVHTLQRTALVALLALVTSGAGVAPNGPVRAAESRKLGGRAARCGWHMVAVPASPAGFSQTWISDIASPARNDVWMVGAQALDVDEDEDAHAKPLVLHFDGRRLVRVPLPRITTTSPVGQPSLSAVAASRGHVWVVGGSSWRDQDEGIDRAAPLALHWNGKRWAQVDIPSELGGDPAYWDVAAVGRQVWIVGTFPGYDSDNGGYGVIFDGRSWNRIPSAATRNVVGFRAVTAISPSNVWLFTSNDDPRRRVRWNGQAWQQTSSDRVASESIDIFDASASGPENIWAVGWGEYDAFVERYDGHRWRALPIPRAHLDSYDGTWALTTLDGVKAFSKRDVWAVGNFGIEHYDGARWQLVKRATDTYVNIAGASPRDMWAAGSTLEHYTCSA